MATCRTCTYLRKCIEKATKEGYEHNVDFDPKDGCTGIGYKSNANADRIRAMSDEELAKSLSKTVVDAMCYLPLGRKTVDNMPKEMWENLVKLYLQWLKQPAEED